MLKRLQIIIAASLAAASLAGCGILQGDAAFAKSVMSLLINNRYIVRPMIDWRAFTAMNYDIGREYSQYKTDQERANYERAFITNFSKGFKSTGTSFDDFYRWRIQKKEEGSNIVVVAADYKKNKDAVYYFHIKHEGLNKKLVGIEVYRMDLAQPQNLE